MIVEPVVDILVHYRGAKVQARPDEWRDTRTAQITYVRNERLVDLHVEPAGQNMYVQSVVFRHPEDPAPDGYYCEYPPDQAEAMDFGAALAWLKEGHRLTRDGWNGPGQWIGIQEPNGSQMTLPYIFIKTVGGDCVPWLASQTDILATDWKKA